VTNEERNTAQDILDGLLRDAYSRGVMDAKSESESIIKKLEKQNTMMLDTLKRLTKYTKALDVDCSLLMGSRVISTEERDEKSMWAKPIIESCEMIAYVEGDGR
jgi:hypothetical protein